MFALLILLSQKQDPSRNESFNPIKRCKCVEYFWWIVCAEGGWTPLHDPSLSVKFGPTGLCTPHRYEEDSGYT